MAVRAAARAGCFYAGASVSVRVSTFTHPSVSVAAVAIGSALGNFNQSEENLNSTVMKPHFSCSSFLMLGLGLVC